MLKDDGQIKTDDIDFDQIEDVNNQRREESAERKREEEAKLAECLYQTQKKIITDQNNQLSTKSVVPQIDKDEVAGEISPIKLNSERLKNVLPSIAVTSQ